MKSHHTNVPLSDVLIQRTQSCKIVSPEFEQYVTVKLYGGGAVPRILGDGKGPKMSKGYRIRKGDLVYSRIDARNGAFAIVPDNLDGAVVSKDFPTFEINRDRVLTQYLMTFLSSRRFFGQLKSSSFGTTNRQRIAEKTLLSYTIPLLPVPEQENAVKLFNTAQSLMSLCRESSVLTSNLSLAIFLEMFGDPELNPMAWQTSTIGDMCELVNGRAFKPSEWQKEGMPIIRIQNLNDHTKPFNYYSRNLPEQYRVLHGDILLSWSGTPGTSFGCFRWNGPEGWLNQHIYKVALKQDLVDEFFIQHVNAKLGEIIRKAHGGVGLQHITKGKLESTVLMIPPLTLQREFVERVVKVRGITKKQAESRELLDNLFRSLVNNTFGGEL